MMDPSSSTRPRAFGNRGGDRSGPHRKTNRRAMILALLLGTVAAVLIVFYLGSRAADGDQQVVPTMEVVVASRDIESGQKITGTMVAVKVLPTEAVIPNTATSIDQVVGQTLRYPVAKGEQVSKLRLIEPPKVQALSFQIPQGLRAFTIPVSVSNTPAALIVPGDHVDVLVTGPLMPAASRERLKTLAAGRPSVRVLEFVTDPCPLFERADRVIAMGGYNTICEIMEGGRKAFEQRYRRIALGGRHV